MSEPSPFVSMEQKQTEAEQSRLEEQERLRKEQLENELIFKELNEQRLRELEQKENEEITEETYKEHSIKDKTLKEFLAGFSETILGIINDILYKLSNPQDKNFMWIDILTTGDRVMYLGILIILVAIVMSFLR